jgi:sugar/nucleoside kinase (ribokinase family)
MKVIVAIGTIGLDTTYTPTKKAIEVLGGSAVYFSLASSFFHPTGIVGVIGTDFPEKYQRLLDKKVDLRGVQVQKGRTFRYVSKFGSDLNERTTIKTELNVLENFQPSLQDDHLTAEYLYLGNIDPDHQLMVLEQMLNPKLVVSDTIKLWIDTKREQFMKVIARTHVLLINNEEMRLLSGITNLVKCSQIALDWGINCIVVKKGEHGALLSTNTKVFPSPAFPIAEVIDPTGAGDAFAGGFLGHIARQRAINETTLKEAIIYGHVMGSFVVEDFSVNRLLTLSNAEIEERFQEYLTLTSLTS